MPAAQTPISFPQSVRAALEADPKRTGLLLGLGLLLAVLCARALRGGPATSAASILPLPSTLSLPGPEGTASQHPASNNALIEWLSHPKRCAKRNLFAMNLDAYPVDPRGAPGSKQSNSSDESAKSVPSLADQTRVQDGLAKQAAKLTLQSTFLGPAPTALVNGQLVREGDTIGQFQVIRIEPRRIAIQQNGVTLQLSMD